MKTLSKNGRTTTVSSLVGGASHFGRVAWKGEKMEEREDEAILVQK